MYLRGRDAVIRSDGKRHDHKAKAIWLSGAAPSPLIISNF